jgi:glycosyltransferase involved in cell wall biosynthesis
MKDKPDTLVILTPAFPADETDGNWLPAHQSFVRALKEGFPNIDIVVLTLYHPGMAGEYAWNNTRVFSMNAKHREKWRHILLWNDVWRRLSALRRTGRLIGIMSFWCGECALIGAWFARLHGVKHRIWINGMDARKDNKWVKYIRPDPGELVAMSPFLLRTFQENHGVEPRHMIPNAVDPRMFLPIAQERDIDVFGAGSLVPLKQYDLFIEAISLLKLRLPSIRAQHCGGGGERDRLQQMICLKGLEDTVCLLGERPHAEILEKMQRTKVFLHPSAYEGYSTVCLEALYAGAHVISLCHPMDDAISRWHVVGSLEEMAEKALEILLDPDRDHSRLIVYSVEETAKKVMRLYS